MKLESVNPCFARCTSPRTGAAAIRRNTHRQESAPRNGRQRANRTKDLAHPESLPFGPSTYPCNSRHNCDALAQHPQPTPHSTLT
jgi:hypothetical protein